MKRQQPDQMLLWPADRNGPAQWGFCWASHRRCPRGCEFKGEGHGGYWHVVYVRTGQRSRPVPLLTRWWKSDFRGKRRLRRGAS